MDNTGKRHAKYGNGRHQIDSLTAQIVLDPSSLVGQILTGLSAPNYQPPMLPAVALELMALVQDPDVKLGKVQHLVQSEPMIAAKVLQLAQSAMYSRGAPITSLEQAIARLGLNTLMDLFLQVSMSMRVFRAKGYEEPMNALRRHSVVVGHAARSVCRLIGFPDEYAFLCGLLHDVGIAAGILLIADTKRDRKPPQFDGIEASLLQVHAEASGVVGRLWKLPADVQLVLAHHHAFAIEGRVHPLAAAICLADWMAGELGAGFLTEAEQASALNAIAALQLRKEDVTRILGSLAEVAESV